MKRADIQVGQKYDCKKGFQLVTCRIISKHLFGFLLREQHYEHWDYGWPLSAYFGWVWSWNVVEEL